MGNSSVRETTLTSEALRSVTALLPASWSLAERADAQSGPSRLDAGVDLIAPNGDEVSFVVEAKRSGSVPTALLLRALRDLERQAGSPVLLLSDYIGPSLRAALADEGISFADATGWVRIFTDRPLILLTGQGADRAPRARRASAVTRLNGVAANRAIRALAATDLPVGVRALAAAAEVSPGSVSKLLVTLASEGIVDRDQNRGVVAVRRRALMRRWVRDYSFGKSNQSVGYYIAPRGLDRTLSRLDEVGKVAITGSAAARRHLPEVVTSVVPLRLLALYASDPAAVSGELGLIAAEPTTANVLIAVPQDGDILPAPDEGEPTVAPLALVVADLLTLPGRSDAEAEQLMDALAKTDQAWKE
jgi:hypothetical protein